MGRPRSLKVAPFDRLYRLVYELKVAVNTAWTTVQTVIEKW